MAKIKVLDSDITVVKDDFISLTDMVKNIDKQERLLLSPDLI